MTRSMTIQLGDKYGRLTITKELPLIIESGYKKRVMECRCDCGNVKVVRFAHLRSGNTTSCGCASKEFTGNINRIHGKSQTKLYRTWLGLKARTRNSNKKEWPRYGGRGIKCLWKSYKEFEKDMEPSFSLHLKEHGARNTTIERIDNDGHYCKENCKWATIAEQNKNTSRAKKYK